MGIGTLCSDFANWGTVVGLPHIANSQNKKWMFWWTIVFLILLGVFSYELWLMISTLLSYPSAVNTKILSDLQRFPAVTICNQNPYKKSVVYSNAAFGGMKTMLLAYEQAISIDNPGTVNSLYTFGGSDDDYITQWKGTTWLSMEAAKIAAATLKTAMYSFADLIAECQFNGQPCTEDDFTPIIDPIYGQCFSFNYDASSTYNTSRAGMKFGLKLIITPQVSTAPDDWTAGKANTEKVDYLPTTWLAGARVYIGSSGDYPQMFGSGQNIPVGYQTGISITSSKIFRAPPPCGECDDDNGAPNFYTDYTYSMETCFDTCRQKLTQDTCRCSNPRYPKGDGSAYCDGSDPDNIPCMLKLQGDQASSTNPNKDLLASCGCTPACDENTFGVTMSLAQFPAQGYDLPIDGQPEFLCNIDTNAADYAIQAANCKDWVSNNALQMIVYFSTLKYERYTEECSYTMQDLINNLGGHAGLWLGLSVISVVECVGFLIILLLFCFSCGSMKVRPSDSEYQDDCTNDLDEMDKELDARDRRHESLKKRHKSSTSSED